MDRITSIDVCRGIAIISMITADIPVVKNVGMNIAIGIIRPCAGMFAAPFFLFIAGFSYELFVISRLERNRNTIPLNIETFWRAIILLAITQILFFSGVLFFPSKFTLGFNSSIFFIEP